MHYTEKMAKPPEIIKLLPALHLSLMIGEGLGDVWCVDWVVKDKYKNKKDPC